MDSAVYKLVKDLQLIRESVCDGKKSMKPWRTPEGPKKFAVCVGGKVVRFGDPSLEIKRDSASRRKNFRARHGCGKRPNTKNPKKAGYWACKTWEKGRTVGDVVDEARKLGQSVKTGRNRLHLLEDEAIPGGLARHNKPSDFDPHELAMGIKVEKEHLVGGGYSEIDARNKAREIAMDHLKEIPDYYTRLKKMEKESGVD